MPNDLCLRTGPVPSLPPASPFSVPCADPDARARETEARMTDDERFSMLYSLMVRVFGKTERETRVPEDLPVIAGYVSGVARLGIPALKLADASLGLRHTEGPDDCATALPCGLAMGATFNPALARTVGNLIGKEGRARGFNVMLGGGINLVREVRNGRNFEYISEDPLLSGLMGAGMVSGTQEEGVIGVLKHVSLNASETNKFFLDAIIDPAAHRESDLLAFQIAIERSEPGADGCLQPCQRCLRMRQSRHLAGGDQSCHGLQGLGDVGLASRLSLGFRLARTGPAFRCSARRAGVVQ